MKFDVVVGNPPYQEESIGDNFSDNPIYYYFYDLAEKVGCKYCLISPARFLFNVGKTPKEWNEKMLNDEHLKVIKFEQKSGNIFPNTDIMGGVAVIYRDFEINFGKIGEFISSEPLKLISQKTAKHTRNTLDEIISNRGQYRYSEALYREFPQEMLRTSDARIAPSAFERFPEFFLEFKPNDGHEYVKIIGRNSNGRCYRWFKRKYLSAPTSLCKFKVIIPKANGSGAIGGDNSTPLIGEPLIGEPLIGFTETFISIGAFDSDIEAQNAMKYIKSKFARTLLGVLKITQNNSKETWSKVPLQDFTSKSDIDWTQSISEIDKQLYKKYGLDQTEINFIEEKVKAME